VEPSRSKLPGERRVVLVPLLEEGIPALLSLIGSVGESRRLSRKELLSDEAIIGEIERVLEHLLGCRALRCDLSCPLECSFLEVGVWHYSIDHAHVEGFLGAVVPSKEEDLACTFLPDLTCKQRRSVASIEACNVGVGLLEHGVIPRCERQVAHNMEAVATTDSPSRYDGDDDLGHESNEALNLEDVESSKFCGIDSLGPLVFVSILASDALVAT
jgi:hypothetical protein